MKSLGISVRATEALSKSNLQTTVSEWTNTDGPQKVLEVAVINESYPKTKILVAAFHNSESFLAELRKNNYQGDIYKGPFSNTTNEPLDKNEGIWLGREVPVDVATGVIRIAKAFYPQLKYIYLTEEVKEPMPEYLYTTIFVGGATEAALRFGCKALTDKDFEELETIRSKEQMHQFVRRFYS